MILQDVVGKLIAGIGKKPSPISPHLFHLYNKYNCMTVPKRHELGIARNLLEFEVDPEDVTLEAPEEETEQESLSYSAVQELQRHATPPKSRSKNAASHREDPLATLASQPCDTTTSSFNFLEDLFRTV